MQLHNPHQAKEIDILGGLEASDIPITTRHLMYHTTYEPPIPQLASHYTGIPTAPSLPDVSILDFYIADLACESAIFSLLNHRSRLPIAPYGLQPTDL